MESRYSAGRWYLGLRSVKAKEKGKEDILLSGELYLWVAVVTGNAFFVDVGFVSIAAIVADVDVDFLFGVSSIFPSARGATTKVDFPFYLCFGSNFVGSVTPVRRREDTDGNGDAGVKVQIASCWGASTLSPLRKSRVKTDFGESRSGDGVRATPRWWSTLCTVQL